MRRHAHRVFPVLALAVCAVILTSPLYPWPLSWLSDNSFARFCLFWALAVFTVLAFANNRFRPAGIAIVSSAISAVVAVGFILVYLAVTTSPETVPDLALSSISGAILGALAGTWLIYVLEVYAR